MHIDLSTIDPKIDIVVQLNTHSIAISATQRELPIEIREALSRLSESGLTVSKANVVTQTAYVLGFGLYDPVQLAERIAATIEAGNYRVRRIYAHQVKAAPTVCQSFILA